MQNAWDRSDAGGWEMPKKPLNNLKDILTAWNDISFAATERQIDSTNVAESDNTLFSENVYHSVFTANSKNILFSDGMDSSEFVAASQRSTASTFCIRLDDSKNCSNSFSVSWSGSIVNSFFIEDGKDLTDCMFCS